LILCQFDDELLILCVFGMNHWVIYQITKHFYSSKGEWENWNWRSEGDLMLNGAYFTPSGAGASSSTYAKASSMSARPPMLVASMTAGAGVLRCKKGYQCYD